jgi:hypothetical protein
MNRATVRPTLYLKLSCNQMLFHLQQSGRELPCRLIRLFSNQRLLVAGFQRSTCRSAPLIISSSKRLRIRRKPSC